MQPYIHQLWPDKPSKLVENKEQKFAEEYVAAGLFSFEIITKKQLFQWNHACNKLSRIFV